MSNSGIEVTPGFADILPGDSYTLTVSNNTSEQYRFTLAAELFSVIEEGNSLAPATAISNQADLSSYLSFSESEFAVAAGESKAIEVIFNAEYEDYFLGAVVTGSEISETNVGARARIASPILPTQLDDVEFARISSELNVQGNFQLGDLSLGNRFSLDSNVNNSSARVIKPSGDVTMYMGDIRLSNEVLTTQLPRTVFPGRAVSTQSEIVDTRPFWERTGTYTFTQQVRVDGRIIPIETQLYSLPWELVGIILLAVLASSIGVFFGARKLIHLSKDR